MLKYIVEVNDNGQIVGQPQPYQESVPIVSVPTDFPYASLLGGFGVLLLIIFCIAVVKQQTVKIVERFGKFNRVLKSGLNFKIPFIERLARKLDLRIQQLDVSVETKTRDDVFVKALVAVQYFVLPEKAFEAAYKLENPAEQIKAYVFDAVRSQVPKMNLDEVFEKKEDIAQNIKTELSQTMDDFGYGIVTALVTDIDPDEKVKAAMNEINAQQRFQVAATAKGEGEKILRVKQAEGEAESKRLQGVGIAAERKAIADGLEQSIEELGKAGMNRDEVMKVLMLTQYFDTLTKIGSGGKVLFLQHEPEGMKNIERQIRNAMLSAKEA